MDRDALETKLKQVPGIGPVKAMFLSRIARKPDVPFLTDSPFPKPEIVSFPLPQDELDAIDRILSDD